MTAPRSRSAPSLSVTWLIARHLLLLTLVKRRRLMIWSFGSMWRFLDMAAPVSIHSWEVSYWMRNILVNTLGKMSSMAEEMHRGSRRISMDVNDNLGYQIPDKTSRFSQNKLSWMSLAIFKESIWKLFLPHGFFSRPRSELVCIWREHFLIGSEALRT